MNNIILYNNHSRHDQLQDTQSSNNDSLPPLSQGLSQLQSNDTQLSEQLNDTDTQIHTQSSIHYTTHDIGLIPQLQNVVCTVNCNSRLNLKFIAMHARNAEFNPRRFSAVIMRIRSPRATALIFNSGKLVVTGCKSESDCKYSARKFLRILQKLQLQYYSYSTIKFIQYKIENMVATVDVKFSIRLEGLAYEHDDYCSFEPELFPGLIYRMVQPKIVLLIFVSGKIVLTGGKSVDELYLAFEQIYPVLQDYRKYNINTVQQEPIDTNNNHNNTDEQQLIDQTVQRLTNQSINTYQQLHNNNQNQQPTTSLTQPDD